MKKLNLKYLNQIFTPKLSFLKDLSSTLHFYESHDIDNKIFYKKIEYLTKQIKPSYEDKTDTIWEGLYIPSKRNCHIVCTPLRIQTYEKIFYLTIQTKLGFKFLTVKNISNNSFVDYKNLISILNETIRFLPILKELNKNILEKLIPYDIRLGKIKGKYIFNNLMSLKEKEKIIIEYKKLLSKNKKIKNISLNDYLNTASICYKASYLKNKIKNLSPIKLYEKFADTRHGGMIDIKNADSKQDFMNWYYSDTWSGSHPFEIIFSMFGHGIHLYPPSSKFPYYQLSVTDPTYKTCFIRIISALLKNNIIFRATKIYDVLDDITGEGYVDVNVLDLNSFHYEPSKENRKKYFPHIIWDEIKFNSEYIY